MNYESSQNDWKIIKEYELVKKKKRYASNAFNRLGEGHILID